MFSIGEITLVSETRTFGVEFETVGCTPSRIASALNDAGIDATRYGSNISELNRGQWVCKPDGSLGGPGSYNGDRTCEVVSPILHGIDGIEQVRKVLDVLRAVGCKVNETCGMHVHVGARDLTVDNVRNLVKNYAKTQSIINSWLDETRRSNTVGYAKAIVGPSEDLTRYFARLDAAGTISGLHLALNGQCRYSALNLFPFTQYGTVEFRQHHGTVDFEQACAWILYCIESVECSKRVKRIPALFGANTFSVATAGIQCNRRDMLKHFRSRVAA